MFATRPYPATADDHPAKKPARYSAVDGARSGFPATAELHHQQGHDPELTELITTYDTACGSDNRARPKSRAAINWVRAADPAPSEITYRGEAYREVQNATGNRRARRAAAAKARRA